MLPSCRRMLVAILLWACPAGAALAQLSGTEQAYLDTIKSGRKLGSMQEIEALWNGGQREYSAGHYATAFDVFSAMETGGSVQAAGVVGDMYRMGQGVTQNPALAFEHYRRAGEAGYDYGELRVALAYQNGSGVTQDLAAAAEHFRVCADLKGSKEAICARGRANAYETGRGLPPDDTLAFEWYRRGAELGEKVSQRKVGYFMTHGKGTQADPAGAIEWYEKAAAQDEPDALYNLGYAYYTGRGVPQDIAAARKWFEKADAAGSAEAATALALIGSGTEGAH